MQAGKDAYIEKPLALTLWEGRKIVEAARKYGRIVQHGTQCRSSPEILEAMSHCREGAIGEVYLVRGIGHKYRPSIGPLKPETPPSTLNYEMWRGPAPMKPYSANQVHYNWHWFWDTGNGDLGNLAVHGLDVARMAMGLDGLPDRVQSMGGNFVFHDAKETPNFQTSVFRYTKRNVMLEYSIRNAYSNSEGGMGESIPFTLGDKRDSPRRHHLRLRRVHAATGLHQLLHPSGPGPKTGEEAHRHRRPRPGGLPSREISFRPCAAGNQPIWPPRPRRAGSRRRCATWQTSLIASGGP